MLAAGLGLVGWGFVCGQTAPAAEYQGGTPFVYLFDTGVSSSGALTAQGLAAKSGWTLVAEDAVGHKFAGDAVLLNDKLVVVLRRGAEGVEVYSRIAEAANPRAVVVPLAAEDAGSAKLASFRVVENNLGTATVEAHLATADGGRPSASYRLATGQSILEIRAQRTTNRFLLRCATRYVVVPDYFGDDMVFDREAFAGRWLGLPTESFFLNLIAGGDAMVMCVWPSNKRQARAFLTTDKSRPSIGGCEIQAAEDAPLWVAFIEGRDIWHQRELSAGEAGKDVVLDWKRPFAARWRADFTQPEGIAHSATCAGPDEPHETLEQSGEHGGRCRFEADRAVVRPPAERSAGEPSAKSVVVYPLDRSPATPLVAFCPIDVLRNTLGVGPCQYILQTEGLASDTNPTPDAVMSWIERQLKKKKTAAPREQIEQRLRQMNEHIEEAQARIGQYALLAGQLREICAAERRGRNPSAALSRLSRIVERIERIVEAQPQPVQRARQLSDEILGLLGKDDALARCQRPAAEIRRIGAVQDGTLSKCRMAARWLRQQSRISAVEDPRSAELAKRIQARVEQFLQTK